MTYPQMTALYFGLFGFVFVVLSIHVVVVRARTGIHHGDGGNLALNRAIRSHANYAEYVPVILMMVAFAEAGGAPSAAIHWLLAPLFVARLMHPIGMRQPIASISQYAWRATSTTITWLVLAAAAALLLWRSLPL